LDDLSNQIKALQATVATLAATISLSTTVPAPSPVSDNKSAARAASTKEAAASSDPIQAPGETSRDIFIVKSDIANAPPVITNAPAERENEHITNAPAVITNAPAVREHEPNASFETEAKGPLTDIKRFANDTRSLASLRNNNECLGETLNRKETIEDETHAEPAIPLLIVDETAVYFASIPKH
jgi:hypothetical protein